jgi:hypothetical protein
MIGGDESFDFPLFPFLKEYLFPALPPRVGDLQVQINRHRILPPDRANRDLIPVSPAGVHF